MSKKEIKIFRPRNIAIVIFVFLVSGVCWMKIQEHWQPNANPNERWVSQNPYISFVVFDEELNRPRGQMSVRDETIEILPLFDYGRELHILGWPTIESDFTQYADHFLCGPCTFFKDWFVMKVDRDRDGLFEGIDTITFRKEYINGD